MEEIKKKRNNRCRYHQVKARLMDCLDRGMTIRQCAEILGVSIPTLNRYKCCLSAECNRTFPTQDELRFIERQREHFAECSTGKKKRKKTSR